MGFDRLIEKIKATGNPSVVGLDPKLDYVPAFLRKRFQDEDGCSLQAAARAIFAGGGVSENMPTTALTADDLTDGAIGILPLLVKTKLCPSISEARRLVQQGGVTVNDEKVTEPKAQFTLENDLIVKKGKKVFHKVTKG